MRKFWALVGVLLVGMTINTSSFAGEVVEGMAERGSRGVINTVTGIIELPMQVCKGYRNGVGFIENEASITHAVVMMTSADVSAHSFICNFKFNEVMLAFAAS